MIQFTTTFNVREVVAYERQLISLLLRTEKLVCFEHFINDEKIDELYEILRDKLQVQKNGYYYKTASPWRAHLEFFFPVPHAL